MAELGYPYPVPGGDDPAISPADNGPSILGANAAGQTKRILVDSNSYLLVDVAAGSVSPTPAPTTINIFATANATFGIETIILSYTNIGIKWVTQVIGWGQYDGEFLVRINGIIVGGGRTSAADRTLQLQEPFSTVSGDVITVTILEYGPGSQNFRANLIGQ